MPSQKRITVTVALPSGVLLSYRDFPTNIVTLNSVTVVSEVKKGNTYKRVPAPKGTGTLYKIIY